MFLEELYPVFIIGGLGILIYIFGLWFFKSLSEKQEKLSLSIVDQIINYEISFIPTQQDLAYNELLRKINSISGKLKNISSSLENTANNIGIFSNNLNTASNNLIVQLNTNTDKSLEKLMNTFELNVNHLNNQIDSTLSSFFQRINEVLNQTIALTSRLPIQVEQDDRLLTIQQNLNENLNLQIKSSNNLLTEHDKTLRNIVEFTNNLQDYSVKITNVVNQNNELLRKFENLYNEFNRIINAIIKLGENEDSNIASLNNITNQLISLNQGFNDYQQKLDHISAQLQNISLNSDIRNVLADIFNKTFTEKIEANVRMDIDYGKIKEIINSNGDGAIEKILYSLSNIEKGINNLSKNKKSFLRKLFNKSKI